MRKPWTPEQIEQLKALYPHHRTADLVDRLGHSLKSIYSTANSLGLKKTAEFRRSDQSGCLTRADSRALDTRFKPGHVPFNKGKKGWQAGGRSVETQFRKGHRGGKAEQLYQSIGTERITKDGYIQRKVNDDMPLQRRWKMLHNIVWEEHHGPIPRGHVVVFRNDNRQDVRIDNLELISRAELMRRNTIHRYPPELKQTIRLAGKLRKKIHEKQD